jgi:hypothetical protein
LINDSEILKGTVFTPEHVLKAYEQRVQLTESVIPDSEHSFVLEAAKPFRLEEYEPLRNGAARNDQKDDFECVPPADADSVALPLGIEKSMLVKRLREVRVLQSFTRVESLDAAPDKSRMADLSLDKTDWLPAVEVSGEGVFLSLDENYLRAWENLSGPRARAATIRDRHTELLRERISRGGAKQKPDEIRSTVSARYILLHTLAHTLINEWSLDSGYPAASLRERLYAADGVAGVLIYTATSDSAGSLGGVVAQGDHARITQSLAAALNRIDWCSQDPPCSEAEASGTDSLNLAACYACVMVPESSCETNNTFLDRAMLIGTRDDQSMRYFPAPHD